MIQNIIANGCILVGATMIVGLSMDIGLNLSRIIHKGCIWHALGIFIGIGLVAIGIAMSEDDHDNTPRY